MLGLQRRPSAEVQKYFKKDRKGRDFLGCGPVVKTLPMQGVWVRSLVGELRSHKLCSMAKKLK